MTQELKDKHFGIIETLIKDAVHDLDEYYAQQLLEELQTTVGNELNKVYQFNMREAKNRML